MKNLYIAAYNTHYLPPWSAVLAPKAIYARFVADKVALDAEAAHQCDVRKCLAEKNVFYLWFKFSCTYYQD
jgi:hypothetical protein